MPTCLSMLPTCKGKSIKLTVLLLLSPLFFFGQTLTGLWTGALSNDSTTVRKDQSFEIALTEYRGKVYGYSRSEFIVDDTLYYVVKRVKGTIEGDICEVSDDEIIAYNFRGKLDKGIKVTSTFRRNKQDSAWYLAGTWKTNATKKYYSVTGRVDLSEEKDMAASKLFPHLEELNLADEVAFYAERKETPSIARVIKPERIKTEYSTQAILTRDNNSVTVAMPDLQRMETSKEQIQIREEEEKTAAIKKDNVEAIEVPKTKTTTIPVDKLNVAINKPQTKRLEGRDPKSVGDENSKGQIPNSVADGKSQSKIPNSTEGENPKGQIPNSVAGSNNVSKTDTKIPAEKTTAGTQPIKTATPASNNKQTGLPVANNQTTSPGNKNIEKQTAETTNNSKVTTAVNNKPSVTRTDPTAKTVTPEAVTTKTATSTTTSSALTSTTPETNKAPLVAAATPENKKTDVDVLAKAAIVGGRKSEFSQIVNFKADSLELALYDNGEIDGDTVSIYLNGEIIMSRQGLKASALKKTIYITPGNEDFTLVLFAENLGRYPPNTGLLVVHDGNDVYNLRFSSDFQKNAGIIFRRKR